MFNYARALPVVIATRHLLPAFSQQPRAVTQSGANGSLGYPSPTGARLAEPPDSPLPPSQDWSGNEARWLDFSFSCFFPLSRLFRFLFGPRLDLLLRITQPPPPGAFPREKGRGGALKAERREKSRSVCRLGACARLPFAAVHAGIRSRAL